MVRETVFAYDAFKNGLVWSLPSGGDPRPGPTPRRFDLHTCWRRAPALRTRRFFGAPRSAVTTPLPRKRSSALVGPWLLVQQAGWRKRWHLEKNEKPPGGRPVDQLARRQAECAGRLAAGQVMALDVQVALPGRRMSGTSVASARPTPIARAASPNHPAEPAQVLGPHGLSPLGNSSGVKERRRGEALAAGH